MRSFLLIVFAFSAVAAGAQTVIQQISGQVDVKTAPNAAWVRAEAGMELGDGVVISTGYHSQAVLRVNGDVYTLPSLVRVRIAVETRDGMSVLVIIGGVISSPQRSFLPRPPIGAGINERIKVKLPENAPAVFPPRDTLANAGFTSSPAVPKNAPLYIEVNIP